ncbi:hypothetical protein [Natrarchaeobius oligotrophus]|uniref:Uncharacterized protein n=1 Tax=Natrarchaeobius chitinivorans TaxID=1679083 RepID=A0A3N6MHE7_NATCH|nr:hypothetical protein [Natrarchaeobius chitinivorans]RQH03554.1 hypothetical protein EA472_01985 [Natrarchaeobius chitinivorans]
MVLHFGKATSIFLKTLPWVAVRFAVGAAFALLAVGWFGLVLWILFGSMGVSGAVGLVLLLLATVVFGGFVALIRRYVLYLVTAGHIAVIAHAVDTGDVPDDQLRFGKQQVMDRFVEASALFAVDQVIKTVIKQFNRAVASIGRLAEFVPALRQLMTIATRAIGLAASYIDQAILAHMFLHEEKGTWTAARDGLVLYGKTWKPVLGSTLLIVLGMHAVALAFVGALAVLSGALGGFGTILEIAVWLVVGGVVAIGYFGLLSPWIKTVVITTYLVEAEGQTPDSETMDYIADRSSAFTDLLEKAENETEPTPVSDRTEGEPTPSAPS